MTRRELKYFSIGLILSFVFAWAISDFRNNLENLFYAEISKPFENMVFVQFPPKEQRVRPDIQARAAISLKLYQSGKEKIIFSKNTQQVLPIASLTKLMTGLVVLENQENYSFPKIVTISEKAASQENVPVFGNFDTGNQFTVQQLLYWMLIYSSNDAAWALSEIMGTDKFVEKMNQRAQEMGLANTYFINPTGLEPAYLDGQEISVDQVNHSTAEDLLRLTRYILENYPFLFSISLEQGPYVAKNGVSNLFLPDNIKVLGGKTGYTDEAGGCVLLASVNQKETTFIDIILGASSSEQRIVELQKLINWKR